ncbi:MAG: B12-binding domain-containing radical SAM protein [candidate division FCPU426 bacterium]
MNILLVYPKHPQTFWSFKYALRFISKKASFPPLGLLTIAAQLPAAWNKKLVDLNVKSLRDRDLQWADYVFLSGISIQRASVLKVIERCRQAGVKIVAGGPLFTSAPGDFQGIDHLVLNEAEITLPRFVQDLEAGCPQPVYATSEWADLTSSPPPEWNLISKRHYAAMSIQYSRGCPFNCDFCDITVLYGCRSRTKSRAQVLEELDRLYQRGWRGPVFFVDDNFIGNTQKLKHSILPAISEWMERHRHPFTFLTQTSINLADDDELLPLLVKAGFNMVFIGIESPNEASLAECSKTQNKNRDLLAAVQKCQQAGLQVQAGFIVGFDNDPASIFDSTIAFIQQSGIVTAMVGLLNAMKGTRLHAKLEKEQRLVQTSSGDNTNYSLNFKPRMNRDALLAGYRKIVTHIYAPANYYARIIRFLKEYRSPARRHYHFEFVTLAAFFKSIVRLGIIGKERLQYWKLLLWSLFRKPRHFPLAVTLAIYGFHFRKIFEKI